MTKHNFLLSALFLIFFSSMIVTSARSQDYMLVPGVVGVHTDIGTGVHSLDQIVKRLEEKNIPIAVITEHTLIRCEYGLFPLRKIVKKAYRKKCLLDSGVQNYLDDITRTNKSHPKVVIIPGTEVAPFYYWTGSYSKKDLIMHNWHKQFLVIGLNKARDFEKLPMVSNPSSAHYTGRSVYFFWPLILLILGFWLVRKQRTRQLKFKNQVFTTVSFPYRVWGVIIIILGALFLINNFPFKDTLYDQYHGDQREAPYQKMIDYANEKDALTFWSLPEATTDVEVGGARSYTPPFPESLLYTRNYSGFSAFYEGWRTVANPGGIWDKILNEYCEGKRERPVWAIGEVDYRYDRPGKEIDDVQTVFLISQLSLEAVFDALKKGRIYALDNRGEGTSLLDSFIIKDNNRVALMGETLFSKSKPIIKIKVSSLDPEIKKIKVRLIRKGEIIKTFDVENSEEIIYEDDYYKTGEKIYYRLDIVAPGSKIISNPIFVEFTKEQD